MPYIYDISRLRVKQAYICTWANLKYRPVWLHKISKNLDATSKFQVPHGSYTANFKLKIQKY